MSNGKGSNTAKRTNFKKFNEGWDKIDWGNKETKSEIPKKIEENIDQSTLDTLQKFHNNPNVKIPKNFISFKVGTSSTQSNSKVAEARLTFLKDIIRSSFEKMNLKIFAASNLSKINTTDLIQGLEYLGYNQIQINNAVKKVIETENIENLQFHEIMRIAINNI